MVYPIDITGSWVTSFNNWFQSDEKDLPQLFRIINNRLIGWGDPIGVNDRFDKEYFTRDEITGDLNYWTNPATQEFLDEYKFLQILNPVPTATLSCFKFDDKNNFSLWVRFNNLQAMTDWPEVVGNYEFEWYPDIGTYGGTITISETSDPNGPVHARLAYLLMSPDEIKFIMAYKDNPTDPAPSGAGTMRRVNVPPPV